MNDNVEILVIETSKYDDIVGEKIRSSVVRGPLALSAVIASATVTIRPNHITPYFSLIVLSN